MECLQSRIGSFNKPVRVQNASKTGAAKNIKWPHPPSFIAKPLTLAEAGFYFDPSYEERDNVTCFFCGKELAGWEEHDDPFEIHWRKCAKTCAWAVVRCALKGDLDVSGRFLFTDKNRLPSSKLLEKARQQVYAVGDGWIHDQVRSHGASSKRMAKAGFLFTPQHLGDDSATCLYCNLSLNEWDSEDDPLEEHRKRRGTVCPFFIGSVSSSNTLTTSTKPTRSLTKPPSSSRTSTTATTRGRSRSVMPDIFEDTIEPLAPPAEAGPSRKSSKKASSSSRSRSRKTIMSIEEEPEDEHEQTEEVEEEPEKKHRASTRSLSRSVSRKRDASSSSRGKKAIPTVNEEEEEEVEEPTTIRSTTRSTKKGPGSSRSQSPKSTKPMTIIQPEAEPAEEDEDDTDEREIERATLGKSKKSSKSSSRSNKKRSILVPSPSLEGYTTAPEEVPEDDDDDDDDQHREEEEEEEEEDSPALLVPKKKPSSRSVTKTKTVKKRKDVPLMEEDDEDQEIEEQRVLGKSMASKAKKHTTTSLKKSTTTARGKKPTTADVAGDDDDGGGDGELDQQILGKPSTAKAKKKKSTRTKKVVLPTTTEEEEAEEEIEEEKPALVQPQPPVTKTKKFSKVKQKSPMVTTISAISAATSIATITTGSIDQDEEEKPEPESTQQKSKSKSKSYSSSARVNSVVPKKENQSLRVPGNEDEDANEEMGMDEESVIVNKTAGKEKKAIVKAVGAGDDSNEANMKKSGKGRKKKQKEVRVDGDEEMRTPEEVIVSKTKTKEEKSVKGKKKQDKEDVEEDEDAEIQAVSATLKKPSLSVKSVKPKVIEKPLEHESVCGDGGTSMGKFKPSTSHETKSKSKQSESTSSKVILAEEQTSKPSISSSSDGWPFNTANVTTTATTTLMKWDEPTQQISSDYSDSDVEMEDATIVRRMMKTKKSTSAERLQLPSTPPAPSLPPPQSQIQAQSQLGHEQEKSTNSEDEVQADLEDVELDVVNDTEIDDHIVQEEAPPERHDERGGHMTDEEAISFAPRLVTKASSEAEQQRRPRTPNLVPFQTAMGSVAAGNALPPIGGLGLGSSGVGREEKKAEVEVGVGVGVKKIPRTPPRKFVFEGVIVPPVPGAGMNTKTDSAVAKGHEIDVDDLKSSTTQLKPEHVEEDHHRQTPPPQEQEQESENSKIPQVQFTPFLSKLPFVPLHVLSDAELDMTVEDWIRYQMEVEYDKFKRDGERELARFRKSAEETRKIIEGL